MGPHAADPVSGTGSAGTVTFHGTPPTHLGYTPLAALGVSHAFTTRHHGPLSIGSSPDRVPTTSDESILRSLGVEAGAVRFARQVHGTTTVLVDEAPAGLVGTGDALVTRTPGRPLAVFTADCLAVILADPERRILAAAHAGWRGTVAGLLPALVDALVRQGARRERLHAAIGPSIGPCCYEVDAPVVDPLRGAFPDAWSRWVQAKGSGKWWLDLWAANTDQLIGAGLAPAAIWNARLCTSCRPDLFFSYRRDGPGSRLVALAVLR